MNSSFLNRLYEYRVARETSVQAQMDGLRELFLLGICIGKGARLSPEEEQAYKKTFGTAEFISRLFVAAESVPEAETFRERTLNSLSNADTFKNWTTEAEQVKIQFEKYFGKDSKPSPQEKIDEITNAVLGNASEEEKAQFKNIAEALLMPLDRVMPKLDDTDEKH